MGHQNEQSHMQVHIRPDGIKRPTASAACNVEAIGLFFILLVMSV